MTNAQSPASDVTLDGSPAHMWLEGSGASDLDLEDFIVETAEVQLDGASQATVNVREEIESVDATGASHVRYRGGADLGDVDTSGGSTINQIDE